jgi:hypothetical protein
VQQPWLGQIVVRWTLVFASKNQVLWQISVRVLKKRDPLNSAVDVEPMDLKRLCGFWFAAGKIAAFVGV